MISDNTVLRNFVKEKILSSFRDYTDVLQYKGVLEDVEDFLLPSLIYFFYSKDFNSLIKFDQYLKAIDLHEHNFGLIKERIEYFLKYCKSIKGEPLGDIHPNKSTKFKRDNKVIYKNFPDYGNVIKDLSSRIFDDYQSFFPLITKSSDYFFRDYISTDITTENKDVVREYYYNLGRIIPFLLFIRSIDLNAENMIIQLPYPVFFDMETIFSGEFQDNSKKYNIQRTGLIKMEDNDTSTLTGGIDKRESLLKPILCGDNENPYIKWRFPSKGKFSNIPKLKGHTIYPLDYIYFIKKGYIETFTKILDKKETLSNIVKDSEITFRVILRPTRIYRFFILKSCYPQVYLNQNIKIFLANSLYDCDLIYSITNKDVLEYEINTLSSFQIPTFYSGLKNKEIFSSEGKIVASWEKSQFDIWNKYQENLNTKFFKEQFKTLQTSIRV